jgi:hypothetical protein
MCVLSAVSLLLSKSRKLQAITLIEFLTFFCLMNESGRRYFLFNCSQMDSAEAIRLDSFGRVASPRFNPKRKHVLLQLLNPRVQGC